MAPLFRSTRLIPIKSSGWYLSYYFLPVEHVYLFQKAAFAPETSSTDLTQFYRDCQNAPPLQLFDLPAHAQPLSTVMVSELLLPLTHV